MTRLTALMIVGVFHVTRENNTALPSAVSSSITKSISVSGFLGGVYGLRGLVKKVAWGLNIEIDTLYMTRDWGWVVIKVGSGWSHK